MSQSLRIKEDSYIKMFAKKEKVAKNHRLTLEKIKQLEKKAEEANVTIERLWTPTILTRSWKTRIPSLKTN